MQIDFILNIEDPNQYYVRKDYEHILTARYDKKSGAKTLYNMSNAVVGHVIPYYTKKLQLTPFGLVQLSGKEIVEILVRVTSSFYQSFTFDYNNSNYTIIRHFGCRFSFFENENQVAYYQTCGSNILSGNLRLVANDNINVALFCLVSLYLYSDFTSETTSSNASFYLGLQKRKFDKKWRPSTL
jgi:hypothetical protein